MAYSGKRPDSLPIVLLLADADVVSRHKATRPAVVQYLDARQPLDVSDPIPARRDQAHGGSMFRWQRLTVHLITEQVVALERFIDGHAARELLGDRQIESTFGIRDGHSRPAATHDPRVVADCH